MSTKDNCPICLEDIENDKNKVITDCCHIFHFQCLIESINADINNCPLCRKEFGLKINKPRLNLDTYIPTDISITTTYTNPLYSRNLHLNQDNPFNYTNGQDRNIREWYRVVNDDEIITTYNYNLPINLPSEEEIDSLLRELDEDEREIEV